MWEIDFDHTGTYLISCSEDATLKLWKGKDLDELPEMEEELKRFEKVTEVSAEVNQRAVYSIHWCKLQGMQDLIATGGGDDALRLFVSQTCHLCI